MNIPTPTQEELQEFQEAFNAVKISQERKVKAREAGKKIEEEYQFKIHSMKSTDKQMFILFAMDGCPACKVLKHLVTYNKDVIEALEPHEVMIVNVSDVECQLIKKYNVYSYPAYYMIDKDENTIKKNYGCNALADPVLPLVNWINMRIG